MKLHFWNLSSSVLVLSTVLLLSILPESCAFAAGGHPRGFGPEVGFGSAVSGQVANHYSK